MCHIFIEKATQFHEMSFLPSLSFTIVLILEIVKNQILLKILQSITECDLIMSFANHGPSDNSYVQIFWFNMKEFPSDADEEIMSAELRLFR